VAGCVGGLGDGLQGRQSSGARSVSREAAAG
jgi:hypothetical protein